MDRKFIHTFHLLINVLQKNIAILHECKESRDFNRMMRQSENEHQNSKITLEII
jgi:hypothetical protein